MIMSTFSPSRHFDADARASFDATLLFFFLPYYYLR